MWESRTFASEMRSPSIPCTVPAMRKGLIALVFVVGALGFLFGLDFMSRAQSAVHEIEALICFLIGAIGVGCGTIAVTVEAGRNQPRASAAPTPPRAPS